VRTIVVGLRLRTLPRVGIAPRQFLLSHTTAVICAVRALNYAVRIIARECA